MWKAGPGIASQYSGIAAVIGRNYNVWTLFEKSCVCVRWCGCMLRIQAANDLSAVLPIQGMSAQVCQHHMQWLSYIALQAVTDSSCYLADALLAKGKDRKPGAGGAGTGGHAHGQVRHALFSMRQECVAGPLIICLWFSLFLSFLTRRSLLLSRGTLVALSFHAWCSAQ